MGIDICGGAEIAVSQPFLDLLEGHPICQQETGTAVSQIVETNPLESMLLQILREFGGQVVGVDAFAQLIDKHIAVIGSISPFS